MYYFYVLKEYTNTTITVCQDSQLISSLISVKFSIQILRANIDVNYGVKRPNVQDSILNSND